jgi:antitoxin (DNA-binding transcriptional repressor) of toxin-antitoxin stability system
VAALTPHVQAGVNEPLIVTKDGHTVAAVVPTDDADIEDMLLSLNPKFQSILERSQQRLESEGGISSEEVRKRLGLSLD